MSINIPFFGPDDVKQILKYETLMPALEQALQDFSKGSEGGISQPLRATAEITPFNGFLMAMPAHVASQHALACKLVSFYPNNAAKNIDTHMATILLFDEETGRLNAMMDGEVITAMRTAAVSAVATKYLAHKTDILAVIGAGVQAKAHIEAFTRLFDIKEIKLWNYRTASAQKIAEYVTRTLGKQVTVCSSIEECVKDGDVIVTATFATEPVLGDIPMKPWVHINSVGAPRPIWQELTPALVNNSLVYVDSMVSANKESGDIIKSGAQIHAEIGEVLLGTKKAEPTRRTIFKSLGMALEDAVSARLVYDNAPKIKK